MKLLSHCWTSGNKGPDSCLETFPAMTGVGKPHRAQWAERGHLTD